MSVSTPADLVTALAQSSKLSVADVMTGLQLYAHYRTAQDQGAHLSIRERLRELLSYIAEGYTAIPGLGRWIAASWCIAVFSLDVVPNDAVPLGYTRAELVDELNKLIIELAWTTSDHGAAS